MSYSTASINSALPAKDLMAALNTALVPAGLTFVETFSSPAGPNWQMPTYANNLYVVSTINSSTSVATSPDGFTWTQRSLPTPASFWMQAVYGGGTWLVLNTSGTVAATSTDGITWTQRTLPTTGTWRLPVYGGGIWVVFNTVGNVALSSPDGVTWTQRTLPVSTTWIQPIYAGGQFLSINNAGTNVLTSSDGITWTARTLPVSTSWLQLAYNGSVYIAINTAASTVAATSPDGVTWTQRTLATSGMAWYLPVHNGSNLWVLMNNSASATINTSPDGITWTSRTLPTASGWQPPVYAGGIWVVVTASGTVAVTSTDGITWTQRTLPVSGNWYPPVYTGSVWVVCNTTGTVALSSPDGITWTARTLPVSISWNQPVYAGGQLVATSTSTVTATSSDGITWTSRNMPGTSASPCADVYKSPGASNTSGTDWYLILRRASEAANTIFYQVAEAYDTSTHKASNFGGRGLGGIPVTGTYLNPDVATLADQAHAGPASVTLAAGSPFTYWFSATPDRVILGVKAASEMGFYAGLYEDLLPAGTTGQPLVAAQFPTAQTNAWAIGSNSLLQVGGFTREPLQTLSVLLNFEARIHNGYCYNNLGGTNAISPGAYTPTSTTAPLYGNPCSLSRVPIGSARTVINWPDAIRGLLYGTVCSLVASVAGDTVTAGGKTYVRFAGPASTYGFFVDSGV